MEDEAQAVSLRVDQDNIAWLGFDLPGSRVNLLTTETMGEIDRRLGELESHIATGKLVAVVVESLKPGTFIAGADVSEIAAIESTEDGQRKSTDGHRIFRRLERLTVPTIAAVDGLCLGGGTELILACDHRVASDRPSTRIGLPEVRLGIVPGFGGCIRLPRLIGIQAALKIILTGQAVSAARALPLGLVDQVVDHERFSARLLEFVRDVLRGEARPPERPKRLKDRLLENSGLGRRLLFSLARKQTRKETKGHYPAPFKALDVIEATLGKPIDDAIPIEAEALGEMVQTEVSRNLVRVFLLQQAAKKAVSGDAMAGRRPVSKAAVLGAGVMGGAIAELIAAHDVAVLLKDIDRDALDEGLRHAADLLRKAGERGVFGADEAGLKFALIEGTLDYEKFDGVDIVIEAVVERMQVKQQVLRECEDRIDEAAVFATNTSSLSVTELASAASRPERVVGLHFFNPVHRMPLVEVVRTERSSDEALAAAFGFALDMGKTPVLTADRPGFLVNRLLAPYLNEAGYLLGDGASVEALDQALLDFGMPMGPCRLLDEIGFDIAEHVEGEMTAAFGERMSPAPVVGALLAEGRLGRKNGRGFYAYSKGRQKGVDRSLARTLPGEAGDGSPDPEEIRNRSLYLLVNEAAHALEEEVVASAGEVDLAMIMGTGFPPFRGGLLRWADREGLANILEGLTAFETAHGIRFAPAPLLRELAGSGRTFTRDG